MSKATTTAKTDSTPEESIQAGPIQAGPIQAGPIQAGPIQADKKGTESNPYAANLQSVDALTGTVLYSTDAPDGTEFDAHVDGSVETAKAIAGEIWIHLDRPLSDEPIVYLK